MQSDLYDAGAPPHESRRDVLRLRLVALRLGVALGWAPAEVASFAAAVAGRPWEELGADDLRRVVEEYWSLYLAIGWRRGRRAAAGRGGRRVRRP